MSARLFVYGTLMPGQQRDDLLLPHLDPATPPRPAQVQGWLLLLPAGYPALLLAPGTPALIAHLGPPGLVYGVSCATTLHHEADWRDLDAWEDYRPGDPESLYLRQEILIDDEITSVYVWNPEHINEGIFVMARRLTSGRFPSSPAATDVGP